MKRARSPVAGVWILLGPFAAGLLSFAAAAGGQRVDEGIFADRAAGESASFLVVLREQADLSGAPSIPDRKERARFVYETLRSVAERSQEPLRERLVQGGVRFRSYWLLNMLEVEGDRALAAELGSRTEVSEVLPNRPFPLGRRPAFEPSEASPGPGESPSTAFAPTLNIQKIRAPEVWAQGFTGQGIVVANADSGFQWDHPALKTRYRGWDGRVASHDYNWHDSVHDAGAGNPCGSDASSPCDDEGHGTGTSGLSVGDDGTANPIGVAPGARLIGCRNMDRGVGTPARYTECFQFFLAPTDLAGANPRPDLGADVINNSWGCPASEGCTNVNALRGIVENVAASGIFVVVSAGNGGSGCSTISEAPAIYGAAFSVGATTLADTAAGFSSRGPVTSDGSNRVKPDIAAPGVSVRTSDPGGGYTSSFSGTSASAPHVAGAVALLWSAAPSVRSDVDETARILRSSAVPLTSLQDCGDLSGASVPNAVFGHGRLDVAAAVALAGPVPPPVPGVRPVPVPARGRGVTRQLSPRS